MWTLDRTMLRTSYCWLSAADRTRRRAHFDRCGTKIMFDLTETGHNYVMTLDRTLVGSPGGLPIILEGKLVGAIGCSGGTGAQDAVVCQAGVDALNRR
ncbi:heme-binding protein [Bradyrhizobium sp. LVM 105]|uniref:GlcG/HbpS family heme-binding protein n=1 Tax=Bradyrhizobium sp. LVM 105 TaxID=2341115 RepID=UPI00100237A3|nr:heme-binding protein [Bradyrhizobium sp. LVM 105]